MDSLWNLFMYIAFNVLFLKQPGKYFEFSFDIDFYGEHNQILVWKLISKNCFLTIDLRPLMQYILSLQLWGLKLA